MATRRSGEPAPDAAQSVESVRQSLKELLDESERLRVDIKANEAQRRKENYVTMAVGTLMALFMLLILVVAFQNNQIAADAKATADRMADCTTAGGKCYEEGRTRTSGAIGDIIKASVYMAECSRLHPGEAGPAFDRSLEACVESRLKAK